MKIQDLGIIFIIIILPMSLILSVYTQFQIQTLNLQTVYDSKLTSATYDAIKAFQLNTANSTMSEISNSKIRDIEASVNTFKNSLKSAFGINGFTDEDLNTFIPALVYTMYDGFYIYAPFENTNYLYDSTTGDPIDDNGELIYGLKPYISYSSRYIRGTTDIVITYSLDNYITIQGTINGNYVNDAGYLIDGIEVIGDTVKYNGIEITEETNLKEYVGDKEYPYVKENGTKFYYDDKGDADLTNDRFFYISNGEIKEQYKNSYENERYKYLRSINATSCIEDGVTYTYDVNKDAYVYRSPNGNMIEKFVPNYQYNHLRELIDSNDMAKEYYKEAYEFTNRVRNDYGLEDLTFANSQATKLVEEKQADGSTKVVEKPLFEGDTRKIFAEETVTNIEYKTSNFNQHRLEIIRNTIEKNLSIAIANYNEYSGASAGGIEFQMPELKEDEWDFILNNITMISFVQGLNIGGKTYNGYAVVNNSESKELVSEENIYIIGNDNQYHRIGDNYLNDAGNIKADIPAGRANLDFRRKTIVNTTAAEGTTTIYYYPRIEDGSYNSIITQNDVTNFDDIYIYVNGMNNKLKQAFYTALGRERQGMYRASNNT